MYIVYCLSIFFFFDNFLYTQFNKAHISRFDTMLTCIFENCTSACGSSMKGRRGCNFGVGDSDDFYSMELKFCIPTDLIGYENAYYRISYKTVERYRVSQK